MWRKISKIFSEFWRKFWALRTVQRSALCRSRRELFQRIFTCKNLASIQPRTSPAKFARSPCTDPPGTRTDSTRFSGNMPWEVSRLVERFDIEAFSDLFGQMIKLLEGSLSSVSTPKFCKKICVGKSSCRDLQDLRAFCTARTRIAQKMFAKP